MILIILKAILEETVKKKMEFYFQSSSVKNCLICSKAKSATQFLTKNFPTYQKNWTIRQQHNHTVHLSSHHIKLKAVGFQVIFYSRNPNLALM